MEPLLDEDDLASSVVDDELLLLPLLLLLLVWAVELDELNELCELDEDDEADDRTLDVDDDELRLTELHELLLLDTDDEEDELAWVLDEEVDAEDSDAVDELEIDDELELLDGSSKAHVRKHLRNPYSLPAVRSATRTSTLGCRAALVRIALAAVPDGSTLWSPIVPKMA